jgi:peptidoglycan hydrolase-like protein with peptidoglycan-binding domain
MEEMMQIAIHATVGKLGRNQTDDVLIVQHLLQQQGLGIGRADGSCGPRTIAGINTFQAGFLRNPDGLIAPDGITFQRLSLIAFKPGTTAAVAPQPATQHQIELAAPAELNQSVTSVIRRDKLGPLNSGLKALSNKFMLEKLGQPRESFSTDCQPVTNATLKKNIKTDSVGPFRVTGLAPAVDSLRSVMADIKAAQPDTYNVLGSAGMLCCRYVRGSTSSISNHSWGTAIDLTLKGVLDKRGDGMVQYGLALIAPIFNKHGWYWGASFPTEDAMHFEIGRDLLESFLPDLK